MRGGILIAAGLLVVGALLSYFLYGQLRTETIAIEAAGQAVDAPDGTACQAVTFALKHRQKGQMPVRAEKGQSITGWFEVEGGIQGDVIFRVFSPHNRLAFDGGRHHRFAFTVPTPVRGDYLLEFDNRFSMFTDKTVDLVYCLS